MDNHNQVALEQSDEAWAGDMLALDKLLKIGPIAFRFAGLDSQHSVVVTPALSLVAYGMAPKGIPQSLVGNFALFSIETWEAALAWCDMTQLKHADWIEKKFGGTFKKEPDSLALAYLLNGLVLARIANRNGSSEAAAPIRSYIEEIRVNLTERGERIGQPAADLTIIESKVTPENG